MRNPAIELYRVLLMFLIVLHHAAYHGHWEHMAALDKDYPSLYVLFTALTVWHVDGFLSITGWFGTQFSFVRFARLWGTVAVYSLACLLFDLITNGNVSGACLSGRWFATTYLYFLFLTPMLNAALEFLRHDKRKLYIAWCVLDIGAFLSWVPCHFLSYVQCNGTGAFSIMNFVVIYLNVRLLKLSGLADRVSKKMIVWAAGIFVSWVFLFEMVRLAGKTIAHGAPWDWCVLGVGFSPYGSYNAPPVMLMAIAGLLLFAKYVRLPRWMATGVRMISPLMFGVYLCHETPLFGRLLYRIPQEWMASRFDWHPLLIVFLSAIVCFAFCMVIERLRKWVVRPFVDLVMPRLRAWDTQIGLSVERKCMSGQ